MSEHTPSRHDRRRDRRRHKNERVSKLRALDKEQNALYKARREYPLVPLDEPYQSGWTRTFTVREDARNRRDAADFFHVLERVNTTVHSQRADFMTRNWKTGAWEAISQSLRTLSEAQYEALSEKEKSFFDPYYEYTRSGAYLRYKIARPFYFVFTISPRIITHRVVLNQEVERRLAEIRNHIERNGLYPEINHDVYHVPTSASRKWNDWDAPFRRVRQHLTMQQIEELWRVDHYREESSDE